MSYVRGTRVYPGRKGKHERRKARQKARKQQGATQGQQGSTKTVPTISTEHSKQTT
jgi:hypothetical protein